MTSTTGTTRYGTAAPRWRGPGTGCTPAGLPLRVAEPRRPAAGDRGHPDPQVDHLPGNRHPKRVWLWCSVTGAPPADADRLWQAFLRRFDLEHTFRMFKQFLDWATPKLRDPAAADRWTWLIITAYAQIRLARSLAADLRLPWGRPAPRAA